MEKKHLTRRDFLRASVLTAAGLVAAACAPAPTAPPAAAPTATPQPAAAPATPMPEPTATPAPAAAAGGGKMVFWPEWGGKDADALQAQVNKYTTETGVTVEFLPIRDHARMIASMGAGNPPDLLMTWDSGAVGSWGFNKALIDLTPYIEQSKFDMNSLHPLGVAAGKLFGKQIGMPLSNYFNTVLYWNKKVFKDAGLDPEKPPETWEDVRAMADKITVVDNGQIKKWGFMVNYGQYDAVIDYGFGGKPYSDDGRQVTPDDPGRIAALEWSAAYYKDYGVDAVRLWISSIAGGEDSPANPFYTGDGGMMINGEWIPSYVDSLGLKDFEYGATYMPYPKSRPELKGSMVANSNPLVIPTGAKNPDAAWKFIEFISRPQNSAEMCVIVGNASPVNEGITLQAQNTKNAMYKSILEEMWTKAKPVHSMTIASPVGAQYGDVMLRERDLVYSLEKTPQEAMKAVKEEVQPELDKALKELGL